MNTVKNMKNNSRKIMEKRRNSLRLLDRAYRVDVNAIKFNPSNTKAHEFQKAEVCWDLLQRKKEFITEAIFIEGGRADVFVLDDCQVIEILHTEQIQDCRDKVYSSKYPARVEVLAITTQQIVSEESFTLIKMKETD